MIWRTLALALLVPCAAPAAPPALSAAEGQDLGIPPLEAAKKMTVPPGFKATLFAGEPDIRQPNAFCIDDRGRLWVAENYSYTGPGGPWRPSGRDRILIFEDKDNDGTFDDRKVFTDTLNFVSGLEIGFGGVWVGSPPNLLFIPDQDGDDKPDGEPQVMLDGWGNHDQHETLNSFLWGPDGWLYGWQGVFVHSVVGKPGTPPSERVRLNAAMWRYHPQKKEFESFAQGTSNPWGFDYDDHGNWFAEACVIPHLWHIIQGGRYHRQSGKHFNPHTYDDLKTIADHRHENNKGRKGGHAHGGARFVLHDLWPDYRGKYLVGTIHHHGIYTEAFERKGSGFVGKHVDDFMMSNDPIYLGFNHDFGPDGSLFVIDWYDPKTCHGQTPEHQATGRIYRISHGDPKKVDVDLRKTPSAELVKMQLDRNDWFVRHARRVLQERGPDPAVHAALKSILQENPDVTRKLRALWALHSTGGADDALLTGLLGHESEYLRGWAIQLMAEDGKVEDAARAKWAAMAKEDPSQTVRLYLTAALQRLPLEQRWEVAAGLVSHPEDADDHNLPLMNWYAIEPLVPTDTKQALLLAAKSKIPRLREFITRRIASSSSGMVPGRAPAADGLAFLVKAGEGLEKEGDFVKGWAEAMEKPRASNAPEKSQRPKFAADLDGRPAVRFDGRDDHLVVTSDQQLSFTDKDDFTLAAWVYLDGPQKGRWRGVVTKSREEQPWYGLWLNTNGQWTFGAPQVNVSGPEGRKGWQHVCAVQSAGKRLLYVDGKLAGEGRATAGNGPGPLVLGASLSVEEYLQGGLDEVRIYRKAVAAADVEKLAAAP